MSKLPLIYLCRHGQTDWNAAARLQGQSDIPLNRTGIVQGRRNGRYLSNVVGQDAERFRFIASPMQRASDTMRLIRAEMGLDREAFERDDRLTEIHFGDWQGFTIRELNERCPADVARREADKWNFRPPGDGAETYAALADRVGPVFEALVGPAIVVAHGGITRAFLRVFAGYSPDRASHTDIPQDRILRVEGASVEWV